MGMCFDCPYLSHCFEQLLQADNRTIVAITLKGRRPFAAP